LAAGLSEAFAAARETRCVQWLLPEKAISPGSATGIDALSPPHGDVLSAVCLDFDWSDVGIGKSAARRSAGAH
jgi:hypothetical protein